MLNVLWRRIKLNYSIMLHQFISNILGSYRRGGLCLLHQYYKWGWEGILNCSFFGWKQRESTWERCIDSHLVPGPLHSKSLDHKQHHSLLHEISTSKGQRKRHRNLPDKFLFDAFLQNSDINILYFSKLSVGVLQIFWSFSTKPSEI